jgi:hypothetical protein
MNIKNYNHDHRILDKPYFRESLCYLKSLVAVVSHEYNLLFIMKVFVV